MNQMIINITAKSPMKVIDLRKLKIDRIMNRIQTLNRAHKLDNIDLSEIREMIEKL